MFSMIVEIEGPTQEADGRWRVKFPEVHIPDVVGGTEKHALDLTKDALKQYAAALKAVQP